MTDAQERIDYDDDGLLDDVAVSDVELFRLEFLSDKNVWIKLYRKGKPGIVLRLWSAKQINGDHDFETDE